MSIIEIGNDRSVISSVVVLKVVADRVLSVDVDDAIAAILEFNPSIAF